MKIINTMKKKLRNWKFYVDEISCFQNFLNINSKKLKEIRIVKSKTFQTLHITFKNITGTFSILNSDIFAFCNFSIISGKSGII